MFERPMRCPDCGITAGYRVDGERMDLWRLLRLRSEPKRIERFLPHLVTCPSHQNRMSLLPFVEDTSC